jgi:hypothetical protein
MYISKNVWIQMYIDVYKYINICKCICVYIYMPIKALDRSAASTFMKYSGTYIRWKNVCNYMCMYGYECVYIYMPV